jgi:hypothetical protein
MTDYLADVVMPEQPVEEPVEEPIDEPVDEPSEDKELELEDESERPEEEEVITEPVKKEKISQEEIFAPPKVLPVQKPKQTRKKGRVMSEKQLQALAAARAKGIETRRRNAAEKKKMKEMEQEEKNLIKEQKVKKFNKLKKAVEEDIDEAEPPTPSVKVVEKERIVEKGYSQEQLDAAVLEAVERSVNRVEVLRKERKAVKKQAQAKEQHDAKVFKEINSALKKPDVWDSCFM